MIYLTSDLHFGHNKEFIYKPRGFNSIVEHDETIINNWNQIVQDDDEVYILGDLMLNDNLHGVECLKRLKGIKSFIRGNHDSDVRVNFYTDENCDVGYCGDAMRLTYNGYHFYLSHYPTLTGNLDKETLKQMELNLFGHTHSKNKFFEDRPYMYNVSVDAHNCYPVSIDTIIKDMNEKMKECKEML